MRAPRDSASMPSAPVPANRSSTRSPSSSPSIANSASLTRSEVGRVTLPAGARRRRPPRRPAITLMPATVTAVRRESARAPRCRARARARRRQCVLRRTSSGSRARISSARARASSSSWRPRAGGQRGTAPGPTGGCRSARPPCASRGRSRPAGNLRWRTARQPPGPLEPHSRQRERCSPRPTRPRSWCSWEMPKGPTR